MLCDAARVTVCAVAVLGILASTGRADDEAKEKKCCEEKPKCAEEKATCSEKAQCTVSAEAKCCAQPECSAEEMEKMMAEWGKPGPEHEALKPLLGTWKAKMTCYMTNPGKATVSEGRSTFKLILGGRYMVQNFQSKMNGKPYHGMGLTGYDKTKKKYTGVWIDNMSTSMMQTEGEYCQEKDALVDTGTAVSPMGEVEMKMVSKLVDDDHMTFAMYMVQGDKEVKMMEIDYTRQSDKPKGKKGKTDRKDKK